MKLNLDKPLEALDGTAIKEVNMAKYLADRIAGETEGQSKVKLLDWALSLFRQGFVELDESDCAWISNFVAHNKTIPSLFGGQIIKEIDSQKNVRQ